MGIKRKTWEKLLFLDISSTSIDALIPSLYQRVESSSIEII
jgi:hypothetical protein